ncbi:MAG: 50S ribosomal protein L29 [Verrucomicrobia bacterium]|nr:50S ribosomal protein L29 [Verrucomicrobiota bacterium]
MKTHEIRELTVEELQSRSRELKSQMMHLRIQKATGQMENKSAIGHLKKEVARILTILQERHLGIRQIPANGAAAAPAEKKSTKAKAPAAKKSAAKKAAKKAE